MSKKKANPRKSKLSSDESEFNFWLDEKKAEAIDWSKARSALFPDLKKSTESISLRLPKSMLMDLKIKANKRDIPYQSLLKMILSEGLREL
jgi:predicted DNA binding CopG/RHH family protein